MKVGFVNPNSNSASPRPPLGLLSLATVCKKAGHDVKIIDANARHLSAGQVMLETSDCEVVGISAMTPSYQEAERLADTLLEMDTTVILGGPHASRFPDKCLDSGLWDVVVVGPGEGVILDVLASIDHKTPRLARDPWVGYPVDLNQIPLPDYSLLGDLSVYKARYPHARYEPWTVAYTSRGCPYSCIFCDKTVFGQNYCYLDSNNMLKLVIGLQRDYGIRDITFYDDLFTLRKDRVREFCSGLIDNAVELSWTCESRVNVADYGVMRQMQKAGCRLIYYGIESGNQTILDSLNKGITLNVIRQAIAATREAGIMAAGYFMVGAPGETRATVEESIKFAHELKLDHVQFSICSPLPGSKLYDEYIDRGYPIPAWSEFCYLGGNGSKPMFTTKELTRQYLEETVANVNAEYARVKVS